MDRSASYDFLLVIPSNHGPISWRLEDGDLGRKSQIFPTHRLFNAPAEGVPLGVLSLLVVDRLAICALHA